jgi:hypothetical protein
MTRRGNVTPLALLPTLVAACGAPDTATPPIASTVDPDGLVGRWDVVAAGEERGAVLGLDGSGRRAVAEPGRRVPPGR